MFATALAACASPHVATTPQASPSPPTKPALGPEVPVDVDGPDASRISASLAPAIARLGEGGLELRAAMRIHTHATREEFERAAQHGGDGLRAWTSFDVVDFAPLADWTNSDDDAFDANPAAAYARAYRALLPLQARLGKRIFARILDDAAADGKPGCMLRALHAAGVDTTIASP